MENYQEMQMHLLCKRSLTLADATDINFSDSEGDYYFPPFARRIYCGGGGDLVLKFMGDTAFTTRKNVPDGGYVDGCIVEIDSTSTTTFMVAEQ